MITLPNNLATETLTIIAATENDVQNIQLILDSCSYINELDPPTDNKNKTAKAKMNNTLNSPTGNKVITTLHTIRISSNNKIIGFIECTYGYPDNTYFCISDIQFLKEYQKHGYGQETVMQICSIIASTQTYKHIFVCVGLKNWPSMRFWYKLGFSRIINILGDKEYSSNTFASIVLEKE